jgi:hypothetical protein
MKKESLNNCGCGCNRREFIATSATATLGLSALPVVNLFGASLDSPKLVPKQGAKVKTVFIYSPSKAIKEDPDAWWSWPGTEFNPEDHHKR